MFTGTNKKSLENYDVQMCNDNKGSFYFYSILKMRSNENDHLKT